MSRLQRYSLIGLVALVAIAVAGQSAWASFTYTLGVPNSGISGFTGPYGEVKVTLIDSTHATIEASSLTNSGNIYLFGDGGSVAVNVNATSWTVGGFSGSNGGTGFTPGPYSDAGGGGEDGFGSFNQTINSFDGYTHSSDYIKFTLTNTSGTWGADSSVLTANSSGWSAAGHIFVAASPANASAGALATGYAANGGAIPEPASLVVWSVLAGGAAGIGVARRRRAPKGRWSAENRQAIMAVVSGNNDH